MRANAKRVADSQSTAANRQQPLAGGDASPATQPPAPVTPPCPPKKEDALYFDVTEDVTIDDYLEALLEFVRPQQIRFAAQMTSPARFCVYLDGEQTVDRFMRERGYVRLRQRRLYAYTARQPAFRLCLSNVCPVLPNALLEEALERQLQLRLCSPIAFVKADCANPALCHVLGPRRTVLCRADDGHPLAGSCEPPTLVVRYDGEEFRVWLSVDGEGRSRSLGPPEERQPTVAAEERTVAERQVASASDQTVIVPPKGSDSKLLRKSLRSKKRKKFS